MDPISRVVAAGAAGAGAAGAALYVDDVFSTFLYVGNDGSNRAINNGIDLSGKGGCVWLKHRGGAFNGIMVQDTERFVSSSDSNQLDTSSSGAEGHFNGFTSFNLNGFSVSDFAGDLYNASSEDYVSWSFRKAPGFFDVVTYTGNGVEGRDIAHSLGSVPGAMIVKNLDTSDDWRVYHRELTADETLRLNSDAGETSTTGSSTFWNGTRPTASVFTVGQQGGVNESGRNYVCYLFAHDDQSFGTDSDEAIIKCGSYTGNGSTSNTVTLGFEPQWLLVKRSDGDGQDWHIFDVMRGMTGNKIAMLFPNGTADEFVGSGYGVQPLANGFDITASGTDFNGNNYNYIYIAIRRPHKPPEAGTDVFAVQDGRSASDGTASQSTYTSGFPVDMIMRHTKASDSTRTVVFDRLRGENYLLSHGDADEASGDFILFDDMDGVYRSSVSANTGLFAHMFKRAPGVFDCLTYVGTGASRSLSHNLGVAPELIIVKRRDSTEDWGVDLVSESENGRLNTTAKFGTGLLFDNGITSTTISTTNIGSVHNASGADYIAYLFATRAGISKVGVYAGQTGTAKNIDCGFTAGARFVLIKNISTIADWYLWDSTRGIVSGNDPFLYLNATSAEVTNTDYIDPLNAGFTITSSAPIAINRTNQNFLFLAIA